MDVVRWATLVPEALPSSLGPRAQLVASRGSQDRRKVLWAKSERKWGPRKVVRAVDSRFRTWTGRTVLLRLTLKRRKLPHLSFDPMSDFPIHLRVTDAEANHCFWGYCSSRTNRTFAWYAAPISMVLSSDFANTTSKIQLRLPHTGGEIFQNGTGLVLLSKLAFFVRAAWCHELQQLLR